MNQTGRESHLVCPTTSPNSLRETHQTPKLRGISGDMRTLSSARCDGIKCLAPTLLWTLG